MMLCPRCSQETSAVRNTSGLLEQLRCDSCNFEVLPRDFPSTWHLPAGSTSPLPATEDLARELERALSLLGSTGSPGNTWALGVTYLESLLSTLTALHRSLPDFEDARVRMEIVDSLRIAILHHRDADKRFSFFLSGLTPHYAISEIYQLLLRDDATDGAGFVLLANIDAAFRWEAYIANPADPDAAAELGYSHLRISELKRLAGDYEAARGSIEAAIDLYEDQHRLGSSSKRATYLLADAQRARARLDLEEGRSESARDWLRAEIATWKNGLTTDPLDVRASSGLCSAQGEACQLELALGNLGAAKTLRTEICDHLREWNTTNPGNRISDPLADTDAASRLDTI